MSGRRRGRPRPTGPGIRPIDLQIPWHLQYAGETTQYDPTLYPDVPGRLGVLEGYLGTATAAVLSAYRTPEDWASRADPWRSLSDLMARLEAEFPGRLIRDAADLDRWSADPDGLCWGVLGVSGMDALIGEPADLDRLPPLFDRGVRVFQPVRAADSRLGGSWDADEGRGLTDLGRQFLARLLDLAPPAEASAPRPILDLARMNPRTTAEAIDWLEADADRAARLPAIVSHGGLGGPGRDGPRYLRPDHARRLIGLGGLVGLGLGAPFHESADALLVAIRGLAEAQGNAIGLAIGSDFLRNEPRSDGPGDLPSWVEAIASGLETETASAVLHRNARTLIVRSGGGRAP